MKRNNYIDEWLKKHGDPKINQRVEYELLLNDALNKALVGKDRIKGIPSSNKIAQFVIDYLNERGI